MVGVWVGEEKGTGIGGGGGGRRLLLPTPSPTPYLPPPLLPKGSIFSYRGPPEPFLLGCTKLPRLQKGGLRGDDGIGGGGFETNCVGPCGGALADRRSIPEALGQWGFALGVCWVPPVCCSELDPKPSGSIGP